jgi:hypothetical protein
MLTFFVKGFMLKLPLPGSLIAKRRFLGHNLWSTGALWGSAQEITMHGIKALWATVSVIALTAGATLLPTPASAQIDIPGMVFRGLPGAGFPSGPSRSRRTRAHESKHEGHSKDGKDDDEPTEHSSASNGKSGSERQLSAPVNNTPPPPSQPQPQTATSSPAPKTGGEEPSFSPSR